MTLTSLLFSPIPAPRARPCRIAPSSSLLVKAVRPASKAGVANFTAGSGKRAATAAETVGAGSGVTVTGGEGRTGVAIAGAGARSTLPCAGGLAGGGAGRGAGAATITGAGGRDDDAQALSSATASTANMRSLARHRPITAIGVSAAQEARMGSI